MEERIQDLMKTFQKRDLAETGIKLADENERLRYAINQFLHWYSFDFTGDNQTWQEQADEAVERLRQAVGRKTVLDSQKELL